MLIAGGKNVASYEDPAGYSKTLSVVMPDGNPCSESTLPEMPKFLEGFGMASRKNRYIYLCGGIERSQSSGTTILSFRTADSGYILIINQICTRIILNVYLKSTFL